MDNSSRLESRQQFAEGLAAEAGQLAMDYFLNSGDLEVESKNPQDFVSEADRHVEQTIRDRIGESYRGEDFVGEEGGGTESDAFWCVDPIDGTSNFLAGVPLWGVSVGFCEQGVPTAGAICIPTLDILLSANLNTPGVRHNGAAWHDRQPSSIPTMVLGQGPNWEIASFREAEDIFRAADLQCLNYRCSVVSIAFAALGWTHGYYEEQTNIWDVAAGYVIAQQAGLKSEISRNRSDPGLTFSILTPEIFDLVGSRLAARKNRQNPVECV
jgi:myo-inositol-1(or 4)-monophosphatase